MIFLLQPSPRDPIFLLPDIILLDQFNNEYDYKRKYNIPVSVTPEQIVNSTNNDKIPSPPKSEEIPSIPKVSPELLPPLTETETTNQSDKNVPEQIVSIPQQETQEVVLITYIFRIQNCVKCYVVIVFYYIRLDNILILKSIDTNDIQSII